MALRGQRGVEHDERLQGPSVAPIGGRGDVSVRRGNRPRERREWRSADPGAVAGIGYRERTRQFGAIASDAVLRGAQPRERLITDYALPAELSHHGFAVANHIVVALDLAQDRGRGREILEGWDPEGQVRVW